MGEWARSALSREAAVQSSLEGEALGNEKKHQLALKARKKSCNPIGRSHWGALSALIVVCSVTEGFARGFALGYS